MPMPLLGQVLRRSERREAVMFLHEGSLWVADFIDGEGELTDAATWVRFHCAGDIADSAQQRMVQESALPMSPGLAMKIEELLRRGGSTEAVGSPDPGDTAGAAR